MQHLSAIPSAPLRFLVKHYWGMDNCFSASTQHVERIIPTGLPVLYFYLNDKPRIFQSRQQLKSPAYLCGQYNQFFDLQVNGNFTLFAVVLQPYALPVIFNLPAIELFNYQIPLQDLLPKLDQEITSKIGEAADFYQRVSIIENFILEKSGKNTSLTYLPRLQKSLCSLERETMLNTSQLAENACLSRKQFERMFQHFVGLPPRQFIKVLRLQKVLWLKHNSPAANLTQIALKSGYFDQAHMTRDFKGMTGLTPIKYFSICKPYADFFMS